MARMVGAGAIFHTLEIREGQWCQECALPSVAMLILAATTAEGRILSGVQRIYVCRDCGRQS